MRQLLKTTSLFALALVFTAGMAFGQDNTSTVDQTGDDHSADVIQNGGSNTVELEQADTDLGDGVTNNMTANVRQKFDGNEAYIDQKGNSGLIGPGKSTADAEVDQVGNNNYLDLDQGPFFGNHSADIDQLGNNNTIRLRTSNGGGEANVYFDGNQNKLVRSNSSGQILSGEQVVQKNGSGRTQFIDITVDGNANKIGADQQSGNGTDELTIDIMGSDNFVPTYQGAKNGDIDITVADGYNNFLKAVQNGNNSTATIDLNGVSDNNRTVINQSSAGNTATITVDGASNTATVQQQ
ncbi:hypothetical protein [Salinibacter altiplanensis]|uniref:hypothetical protein n=1 Tax=Salinibacter altiplanensis TaxID=1803181 RepID=UPI000C9F24B4|nr:hypothetical protein [Salinibacter altiplanensis]